MRPLVATVISARPWEARLVDAAVESGLVRLVARWYDPPDLAFRMDAIVVGAETPWLDQYVIARWQRAGSLVIGTFAKDDRAAVALLCRAGVDQLFVEDVEPLLILRAIRDLAGARIYRFTASG